ncbi:uncharacterized protein BDV17DRAFT_294339 [Aspergillus undulatus]|uniref:uncharacterized protein n=1 Tax=Aspergillus undulatus TaxID=1810928 RepID=UPI003CCDF2A9
MARSALRSSTISTSSTRKAAATATPLRLRTPVSRSAKTKAYERIKAQSRPMAFRASQKQKYKQLEVQVHESLDHANLQRKIDVLTLELEALRVRQDKDKDTRKVPSYEKWNAMKEENKQLRKQNTRLMSDAQRWANDTTPNPNPNSRPGQGLPLGLGLGLGLSPYAASRLRKSGWDACEGPYTLPDWAQPDNVKMRAVGDTFLPFAEENYYPAGQGQMKSAYGVGVSCGVQEPVWGRNVADDERFDARMWA